MIITCPECKTRYMIKSEKLGLDPKSVRCAKCKHQWMVNPSPLNQDLTKEKPPLPPIARLDSPSLENQQKELNAKIKKRNFIISSFFVILILGTLISSVVLKNKIMATYPSLIPVYEMIGFTAPSVNNKFSGLEITDIERHQDTTADMTVLSFSGKIKNLSDVEVPVPNVKVQLFDEDGILLDEWTAQPEHKTLKTGEVTTWICRFYDPQLNQISQYKTFFEQK